MTRMRLMAAGFIALAVATPQSASAQFYAGKTINIIVNYPAGGPTDIEGRIVAQHLPAHIPGTPTVIVRNVGGAGGLIGSNQLGEAAPNGDTIGFFTLAINDQLLGNPSMRTRYSDFALIAGVECPLVVYMRKDTPPGIHVPADLMKAKDFKALSLNVQNTNSLNMALALDLLGDQIPGGACLSRTEGCRNRDPAEHRADGQLLALRLERFGRADHGQPGSAAVAAFSARQEWRPSAQPRATQSADVRGVLRPGASRQVAQGADGLQGVARLRRPAACDVPRRDDAAESVPRGAGHSAHGIRRMWKDPQFLADYAKVIKTKPIFVSGSEGQAVLASLGSVQPGDQGLPCQLYRSLEDKVARRSDGLRASSACAVRIIAGVQ